MHVCLCEGEREQEGENQVENMTKAMKGTKQQKINQSINGEAFELPPDMAQTHQLPL